jgi:hypothetical protein
MNFKDIPLKEIKAFLTLNNVKNINYNTAISLINDGDFIPTESISNWLLAYQFRDILTTPIKYNSYIDVVYHNKLFDTLVNQKSIIDIYKYLHLYVDINLIDLPQDILGEIILYLDTKNNLNLVCKHFYNVYINITNNQYFMTAWYTLLLKPYYSNFDVNYRQLENAMFHTFPPAGNVLHVNHNIISLRGGTPLDFYVKIVKVVTFYDKAWFLSSQGTIFVIFNDNTTVYLADTNLKITDMMYNSMLGMIYLSKGRVYRGHLEVINRYSYNARTLNFQSDNLAVLHNIDNVISMCCTKETLFFLTIDGNLYKYEDTTLMLTHRHCYHIAATKHHHLFVFDTYILIDNVPFTLHCDKVRFLKHKAILIPDQYWGCPTLFKNIKNLSSHAQFVVCIDQDNYVHTNNTKQPIDNAIAVTLVPSKQLEYYVIVK